MIKKIFNDRTAGWIGKASRLSSPHCGVTGASEKCTTKDGGGHSTSV